MADIHLSPAQEDALRKVLAWWRGGASTPQVFYLAGLAGVGKSTIYALLRQELYAAGAGSIVTCTPTGKAANVLRNKGVTDATTCHGALYIPEEDEETGKVRFKLNRVGPAFMAALICIDEGSMVDDAMGADFIATGTKILVMADPGQLPPVKGLGFFTSREPDVFLTEIHRQAKDSPIIRLAHMLRNGKLPDLKTVGHVTVARLDLGTQPLVYREETQAICGVHRVRYAYTQRIREQRGFSGGEPRKGERIICRRNNREHGLFNGCQGVMLKHSKVLGDGMLKMSVSMDDLALPLKGLKVTPWHFQQHFGQSQKPRLRGVDEFDWGYVLTAHASQGSEWDNVTVVDDSGAFRDDRWKWLYTTVTRSSDWLTLLLRG